MPYGTSKQLPAEQASKLGHLGVLNSGLVNELIESFEYQSADDDTEEEDQWVPFHDANAERLPLVFAVDGSFQVVTSERPPYREMGFVKTALLRMDPNLLRDVDPQYPHPHKLREIMKESALFHSTVFPLRGVEFRSASWIEGVRGVVRDSLKDPRIEDIETWETLKWLLYRKWVPSEKSNSPDFACPVCNQEIDGLPFDSDEGTCPDCGSNLTIADVIGLHMEMFEDGASQALATSYMAIHELLLLFSAIRYFWVYNRRLLRRTLFLKDGPLSLRSQYSKLVPNIRDFIQHALDEDVPVHLIGQEKSGAFFDHLQIVQRSAPPNRNGEPPHYLLLSHDYIRRRIQRVRDTQYGYGERTNYGEKVFIKAAPGHPLVLNVATGAYVARDDYPRNPSDLVGFNEIMATVPSLLSHQHEGGLVPIQLAHGVASLSSYPSAQVLKLFAGLE
jgi:hypothetical protein